MSKQAIDANRRSIFMIAADDPRLVIIGRDTNDSVNHPLYDSRCLKAFDEDIVRGMMKHGVKLALAVSKPSIEITLKDGSVIDDPLCIVDGRQRLINAREADRRLKAEGLPGLRIPINSPERGVDAKLQELLVLLNEHRQEDTALGRAQKAQQFVTYGYAVEDIAPLFRCTPTTIHNYLSLLNLRPEIQALIESGKMPASTGYQLAREGAKAQAKALEKSAKGEKVKAPKPKAPSKAELRALLYHHELPPAFLRGILFALGDLKDLSTVEGLPAVLEAVKAKKTAKAA